MHVEVIAISGPLILTPDVFTDERGFFMESFQEKRVKSGEYQEYYEKQYGEQTSKG